MTNSVMPKNELEGRETAPLVSLVLVVLGLLSAVVGLVLFAGSEQTGKGFAWEFASPVTAALIGAGFLGAVPMVLGAALLGLVLCRRATGAAHAGHDLTV